MNLHNNFNEEWKFILSETLEGEKVSLDDSDWRSLELPHDWSVEFSFDEKKGEGCTGYLLGGVGWYRKHFTTPENNNDQSTYIYFDGVYNYAKVFINGVELGQHPYGYSPFYYDLSPHLNDEGKDNVLVVKVDHTRYADSRWYTGSGIYRPVELLIVNKLHLDIWPVFVTTPTINDVFVEIDVSNDWEAHKKFTMSVEILDADGHLVVTSETECELSGKSGAKYCHKMKLEEPRLWGIFDSYSYTARVSIYENGYCLQTHDTSFGVRTFEFNKDKGFILNGQKELLKGVCLHHDAGLVGAAVPIGVWRRRFDKLKASGCNAIRTAHNPPSEEFLDLCDEMGFFVKHEFFDEWDYPKDKRLNAYDRSDDYISRGYAEEFQQWGESDLKTTMLRDRNHPSIFMWSIGNEIELTYMRAVMVAKPWFESGEFEKEPSWTPQEVREIYESIPEQDYEIGKTAKQLAKWTREIDETRPVTANCVIPSVSYVTDYIDSLDVVGFSYRQNIYDYAHRYYPETPIFGGESFAQWNEWQHVIDRDFVAGMFAWTGIDYMGETNGRWPLKGAPTGLLDFAGFEKPAYYMFKSLWSDEPTIHLSTQNLDKTKYKLNDLGVPVDQNADVWKHRKWGWYALNHHYNYKVDDIVVAEVYSNCEQVSLYLNGEPIGTQYLKNQPDRIFKWALPFEAGDLRVEGINAAGEVCEEIISTAGEAMGMSIMADVSEINANIYDVVHIEVQLLDTNKNPVRYVEDRVSFVVEGDCKILGVDNGAADNIQDYQSNTLTTSQGRAMLIIQASKEKSVIEVFAKTEDYRSSTISIAIV